MFAHSIALLSFHAFSLSSLLSLISLFSQSHLGLTAPIAVSLGAVPGALSRYYVTVFCNQRLGTSFPFGTFLINLSGSLLMGFFATLAIDRVIASPQLQLLVTTGFLGSYTTFSTYALDTSILLRNRQRTKAVFYGLGSSILGAICLEVGILLAHSLHQGGN